MAALKKVDFPVFGFPITPRRREYDGGMTFTLLCCWLSLVLLFALWQQQRGQDLTKSSVF